VGQPSLTRYRTLVLCLVGALFTAGCATSAGGGPGATAEPRPGQDFSYLVGPGDHLNIFVWRNPDVSVSNIPVRPDGRISVPLVQDLLVSGKTPTEIGRDIETILAKYIRDPLVTVTVVDFVGQYSEQVRVVGAASEPRALAFRRNMTVLDVMIAVGGLGEFAAGNKAAIIRTYDNSQQRIRVRLDDLLNDGDISQNVQMRPGDILVIPESRF
jgi:polysaccharide export outer membrane protein